MTASMKPLPVDLAAGAVTWASTLPTATAMPTGRPVQPAAASVRPPARPPSGESGCSSLATKPAKPGLSAARNSSRRVVAVLEDALVAGRADVAGLDAAHLPGHPVGRLDPALGGGVDLGVLLEQLQPLGELPLRGDAPAVAGQPRLAALRGQRVDPVGVPLRGVVLPQLDEGMRPGGVLRQPAQRGAVGQGRQHRARGEVDRDADDRCRVDPRGRDGGGHGHLQHLEVVRGVLQGPVGRERRRRGPIVPSPRAGTGARRCRPARRRRRVRRRRVRTAFRSRRPRRSWAQTAQTDQTASAVLHSV